jgi:hypothetical protein
MKTELTIDQLGQELDQARTQNRQLLKELEEVRRENAHLRMKFQQDRVWLAKKLEIIAEGQIQGGQGFLATCSCGLAAVLEQARKRASMGGVPFSGGDPDASRVRLSVH